MTTRPNQLQSAISSAFDTWTADRPLPAEQAMPDIWRQYARMCARAGLRPDVSWFREKVQEVAARRTARAALVASVAASEVAKIRAATARIRAAGTARRLVADRQRRLADRALTASLGAAIEAAERRERERRRTPQHIRLMTVAGV